MYIPSCNACQHNKDRTTKVASPLHPLSVPPRRGDCITIDFVKAPLDKDGYDYIMTITDRTGADIRLIPCKTTMSAEDCTLLFFKHWYCENSLPLEIISDRNHLFTSAFWHALHTLTKVKLKMSIAYSH